MRPNGKMRRRCHEGLCGEIGRCVFRLWDSSSSHLNVGPRKDGIVVVAACHDTSVWNRECVLAAHTPQYG